MVVTLTRQFRGSQGNTSKGVSVDCRTQLINISWLSVAVRWFDSFEILNNRRGRKLQDLVLKGFEASPLLLFVYFRRSALHTFRAASLFVFSSSNTRVFLLESACRPAYV